MKVYEATVINKCAGAGAGAEAGAESMTYESYVAVATRKELNEIHEAMELLQTDRIATTEYGDIITDEDIHFYFNSDDWGDEVVPGDTIEREEFKYLIGRRVA